MTIWRKSSYSGSATTQSDCVEVAQLGEVVGLRDSKAPGAGHLTVSPAAFTELLTRVKRMT
ncbi:DUF397 domain-containing protein [Actinomadura darangshiensis]|uniref:DUF397 domain-containing protein n=1 Tax=Actinomadura darangshiensis TaxID=705336 RepID=A0A4R5AVR7_9ACTN|nr:DUF397 domain-containing protein [Actinomadura darangshiensis]TDD76565.1 DUF397 domain-containing protein [Actinomadura darangshiensis]